MDEKVLDAVTTRLDAASVKLDALAAKLGVGAERLWEILVRQALVDGYIAAVVAIIASVLCGFCFAQSFQPPRDPSCKPEDRMIGCLILSALFLIAFIVASSCAVP